MYATGIGLVIEGIARAEHQERLEKLKKTQPVTIIPKETQPIETEEPIEEEEETSRIRRKRSKNGRTKKGLDLTQIITKFFSADEINE